MRTLKVWVETPFRGRQFYGSEKSFDPFAEAERSSYASSEQAVVQMKPSETDEELSRWLISRHRQQLGQVDEAALRAIVASLRTNAEVFVIQLRGGGWAWDERATSDTAQAVVCQLLEESVEQLHELSARQLDVVRRVLIPELARTAAVTFDS